MKTKLINSIIALLLFTVGTYSQSKKTADKYFNEFNYKKSAEIYAKLYKEGDKSKDLLSKLGDSFYNTSNPKAAEVWYAELVTNYENDIDTDYLFKYAQVLKNNGNYKKSDDIMRKLRVLDPSDDRGLKLESTPDYVSVYSNNSDEIIHLHNVSLNTEFSDFGGFNHNNNLYFASASPTAKFGKTVYNWTKQPFLNLYKAEINLTDTSVLDIYNKALLASPVTTKFHEASPAITKDGKTMYFTRDNYNGGRTKRNSDKKVILKVYKATLVNGVWKNVKELPFNSNEYSTGHPTLSPDEKTLYFVSNRPGGQGDTDIYRVSINENGGYGMPENLGSTINTKGREMFPFVSGDNTLYFSSDGHLGLGGLDIFESKVERGKFSQPKNIQAPFNSNLDDFSFWVEANKASGFFSSNREGGKGDDDIYSFTITKKPKPIVKPCEQTITGVVKDVKTNEVVPSSTVKVIGSNGEVIKQALSDKNGAYTFSLTCTEGSYTVLGEKKNYKSNKRTLNLSKDKASYTSDLSLKSLIVGNQIVINPIYFDYGKSTIREDSVYELEDIVTVMNANPDMVIKIESHTDSRGKKSYNRLLSDRRAKSTRDYILSRGIARERIQSAIGYGEDQLLNHCNDANRRKCTEEEHSVNRRSYFYIVKGGANVKQNQQEKSDLRGKLLKKVDEIEKKSKNSKSRRWFKQQAAKCGKDINCNDTNRILNTNYQEK